MPFRDGRRSIGNNTFWAQQSRHHGHISECPACVSSPQ